MFSCVCRILKGPIAWFFFQPYEWRMTWAVNWKTKTRPNIMTCCRLSYRLTFAPYAPWNNSSEMTASQNFDSMNPFKNQFSVILHILRYLECTIADLKQWHSICTIDSTCVSRISFLLMHEIICHIISPSKAFVDDRFDMFICLRLTSLMTTLNKTVFLKVYAVGVLPVVSVELNMFHLKLLL